MNWNVLWHGSGCETVVRFYKCNAYTCVNLHNNMNFWLWNLIPGDLFSTLFYFLYYLLVKCQTKIKSFAVSDSYNNMHASACCKRVCTRMICDIVWAAFFFLSLFCFLWASLLHSMAHSSMHAKSYQQKLTSVMDVRTEWQSKDCSNPSICRAGFSIHNFQIQCENLHASLIRLLLSCGVFHLPKKHNKQQRKQQLQKRSGTTVGYSHFYFLHNHIKFRSWNALFYWMKSKISIEKHQAIDGHGFFFVRGLTGTISVNCSSFGFCLITSLLAFFGLSFLW